MSKLITLKYLINSLNKDIYKRVKKLIIFISFSIISFIINLI